MLNGILSEVVIFGIGGSPNLCMNDAFTILDHFEFKCILNMKKPDEGNTMSCLPCQICNQICENFQFPCAILADLCLSLIEHNLDLSMAVQPANEVSC